jgi:hypothetical protein
VRIVTGIVAALALVGLFMVGMVALAVAAGIVLIAGLAIWLRVAWIKRKLRRSGVDLESHIRSSGVRQSDVSGQVIEAEYTVISDNEDENKNAR